MSDLSIDLDLRLYHWILVNSSAGKDSQAMLDAVVALAHEQGVRERLVVVHADLGRVEWAGTRDLAERQAQHYGVRFEFVARRQNDLLDHVTARGKWPSSQARYCTSDHKRGPVSVLMTRLAEETRSRSVRPNKHTRILNCLGLRAEESPVRAQLEAFRRDTKASNGRRTVDTWLPIHGWSAAQVWERIRESGVEYHPAYDLGMPRLSCVFCIFAPKSALLLAGRHNRELLAEYVRVEKQINHSFRQDVRLADIQSALEAGDAPTAVPDWRM